MMPSVDHCVNNPTEMTTLSNSLEVFDTYKHREDKDSDEESFHLPLDDDESEMRYQDTPKNGNGNDTEDEILDKFDSAASNLEPIDSQLEERLLNDDEEEKKVNRNESGIDEVSDIKSNSLEISGAKCDESTKSEENKITQNGEAECEGKDSETENSAEKSADDPESSKVDAIVDSENVPKTIINDSFSTELNTSKDTSAIDSVNEIKTEHKSQSDKSEENVNECAEPENCEASTSTNNEDVKKSEELSENITNEKELKVIPNDTSKDDQDKSEKCENSNDSSKNQNEDAEELFDISIIRDADEDNAENAYNEAHPEESHVEENEDESEDRNDDKAEDEYGSDKVDNIEEDEEVDIEIDKNEDHLKNDDVEIEESNLKLDCDGTDGSKETVSDTDSDSSNRTHLVNKDQVQDTSDNVASATKESATKFSSRLDEVTGKLINSEDTQANTSQEVSHDSAGEQAMDVDTTEGSEKRKSLKRGLSEERERGTAKKSRIEQIDVEIKEVEKPKEKLPLRTLVSLSEFMRNKKSNRRLTMHDLEEFCLQKICEVIVHKSDLGDVHHQLKLQEQLIETMRKEIQQLTKQARDLEIVNKKLMNDLKQQNATQKPLNPLKITRSVGLQVKFTPAFDANLKRRQPNAVIAAQKGQMLQTTNNRGPRNIPNAINASPIRQANSPQKQQQQIAKPTTPILSQALQSRRAAVNDASNKTASQTLRPKTADSKSGAPSASVIDLTDEDDKKDKNKSGAKMVTQKNIAVPLRTPMRVNATPQGIRLTTSQGKNSPITSVVTSSAPQVMYVVQSSQQNVLTSPLGSKAVVVNFQSANGVLTQALNGSAVSVIPKQSNTIQLKTVSQTKTVQNNKIIKMPNKHPAPLPPPPVIRVGAEKPLKPIPPKPHLTIRKTDTGIILQWKMPYDLDTYEVIASYQLYAYQETSAQPSTDMWRKVGDVKALALPMACTLTQFADKNKYYFAVRPVDIHKRIGVFSEPEEISL